MKSKKKPFQIAISIFFIIILGVGIAFGLRMSDSLEAAGSSSSYFIAMDTVMSVTVYGRNKKTRQLALDAAEAEINRLDALLSVSSADGDVYRLNSGMLLSQPAEDTKYLLERSRDISAETDGAFDITIYPLMELWGFATGSPHVPGAADIEKCLTNVGMEHIICDDGFSLSPGCGIDFGAIAKGYASQRVATVIQENGISSALINLGGNVYVIGDNPKSDEWTVAIDDPFSDDIIGTVNVQDKCVITSGSYQRFFEENGEKYHHIIDPATGYPASSGLESVTVISNDPTLADALSTALFVMGYEKALSYWTGHSDLFDMILISSDGEIFATTSWEPQAYPQSQ